MHVDRTPECREVQIDIMARLAVGVLRDACEAHSGGRSMSHSKLPLLSRGYGRTARVMLAVTQITNPHALKGPDAAVHRENRADVRIAPLARVAARRSRENPCVPPRAHPRPGLRMPHTPHTVHRAMRARYCRPAAPRCRLFHSSTSFGVKTRARSYSMRG